MNTRVAFWLAVALPFTALIVPITVHAQSAAPAAIRVGTYDSRAIAVAWVSSNMHRQWLAQLVAERDKAKAVGDEKKVQEIQARGGAEQARVHEQGFSTASVAGLMAAHPARPAPGRQRLILAAHFSEYVKPVVN